ncbi:SRPBCC family protein [Actinospica durhamensis]|uniref:SRPBCC family protein n=1 Tax=Actinospica durhamensis TaxID=1508375 RepID=A0A941EPY6_9ACTN|nr:SRPBCC family protein [Actinospica durhamensis]MBR7835011.1 SRPBCC family protein [Actinospica durhamensis]
MVTVSRTFTVAAPRERVHDYLKDFANTVHWDPGTVQCVRRDHGPLRTGAEWTNTSTFMGRTAVLDYTLAVLEPERLVFRGTNDKAASTDDITLDAPTDTTTQVTYRAQITFHGALRLVSPLLRRPFERLADQVVERMTTTLGDL